MTKEQIHHFQTFGFFLCRQLLGTDKMTVIADAFDTAMARARGGAPKPHARSDLPGSAGSG